MANNDCRIEADFAGKPLAPEANSHKQAQLGCYDQLMADAQRAYPGDPLLQRAATEEKMGPNNFTYGQQKLLEASREFINVPPLQALAVKEAEYKYFYRGAPLTPAEQAKLDAPRAARAEKEDLERFMPSAKKQFPDSESLQKLAARQGHFEATGHDKLSNKDYTRLLAGKDYPQDKTMQDLAAKEMLHRLDKSKPGLSPVEQKLFTSNQSADEVAAQFPNDKNLQALAIKEKLSYKPGQPMLTKAEDATLTAAREFPGDKDLQNLSIRKRMAGEPGRAPLSETEEGTLATARARRDFPDDAKLQNAAVKEQLWLARVKGADAPDREEYQALQAARQRKLLEALLVPISRL